METCTILATGSYLPHHIVRNEDLTQFPPTTTKLIALKTGVLSRRQADAHQCTSDLALEAAQRCLAKSDFPPERIQGIIVSTSSPDRMQPATATAVQHRLGAVNAFAFDINSVCSGSVYGISLADALILSGRYDAILLIASEVYSRILNKKDFSTYPYFGDGAGAILFHASNAEKGVLHSCLRTDGSGRDVICVPGGGTMLPFDQIERPEAAQFRMKGKAVFEFAVSQGTAVIRQLVEEADVDLEAIQGFICHQANINIIQALSTNLDIAVDKFFVNLDKYGNTASASVLIALDEAIAAGHVGPGDLVVTCAFGGGLSWGANLIRL